MRQALPGDAVRLAALDVETNPNPWPVSRFSTVCADDGRPARVLLVGDAGEIDGFVVFSQVLDEATVENIGVASRRRRRGLARTLLGAAFVRMRVARASRCLLEVRSSNLPARALYESLGFVTDGVRPGYYAPDDCGVPEDALLMSKPLWD